MTPSPMRESSELQSFASKEIISYLDILKSVGAKWFTNFAIPTNFCATL